MADKKKKDEDGNLPPLSDFDSQSDQTSDGGLPPLSNFDSDDSGDSGGLPPISDIEVETPEPAGGNIRPAPAGHNDTMDTPAPTSDMMASPGSFQDLAADSDFAPETPELGPGPSSGMDTPTFDTAFGGGFESPASTPAPTQAMETPMFGGAAAPEEGGGGFDAGAFGSSSFGGTPAPDFSPDTGMGGAAAPPPMMAAPDGGGGGGMGVGALIGVALVTLILGIFAGPFVGAQSFMNWMPNPTRTELETTQQTLQQRDGTITQLRNTIDTMRQAPDYVGDTQLTPEALDDLRDQIATAEQQLGTVRQELETNQVTLTAVKSDLQAATQDVIAAEEKFTQLDTATKITQARRDGLEAESERLTGLVGSLGDAATRSLATKDALLNNAEILVAKVREGMPLTPAKYEHAGRVARAESLRDQIAEARWVTPALMKAYNEAAQEEIVISNAQEYFFAKLMVTDRFGTRVEKWSECVMNGNWSVYYRSLDGKNIGSFENLAGDGQQPIWGLNEGLPKETQKAIEGRVVDARTEDYLEKVQFLAEKQMAEQGETQFQRNFDSL